jgi:hydroxymethylbilane synthase
LLHFRPDLQIEEIRGNVPTRMRKFDSSDLDGLVLAFAGIHRLGLSDRITQAIPFEIMLPAVGQGAVAVEVRSDDDGVLTLAASLEDAATRICVTTERAFLRTLEGGCQVPIGAHARCENGEVTLVGYVGSLDGKTTFREQIVGGADEAEALGRRLAERLIAEGAADLLADARVEAGSIAGAV